MSNDSEIVLVVVFILGILGMLFCSTEKSDIASTGIFGGIAIVSFYILLCCS